MPIGILALVTVLTLTGCVGLSVGGGTKPQTNVPTLGQQLIDLKQARDRGAISENEYEIQKAKMLGNR